MPRLYAELASWWHVLSAPEDYAEEAALLRDALDRTATTPIRTLLELGAGGGNNASHLKAHYEMTLVDLAPEMLEASRVVNPELEHIEGDVAALSGIRATLKPGGVLMLLVPAFQALYGPMDELAGHFRRYTRPLLAERGTERKGCMVIGTVQGDLHDIGKNLVSSMLEGAGFEVVDLGADVAPERFVEAVNENHADLLGLSALLTVTMTAMKTTIDALEKAGLRDQVKVLVGGAPLSAEYAGEIGADGYASNASAAVRAAQEFVGG